jgi:hypothetical protein
MGINCVAISIELPFLISNLIIVSTKVTSDTNKLTHANSLLIITCIHPFHETALLECFTGRLRIGFPNPKTTHHQQWVGNRAAQ